MTFKPVSGNAGTNDGQGIEGERRDTRPFKGVETRNGFELESRIGFKRQKVICRGHKDDEELGEEGLGSGHPPSSPLRSKMFPGDPPIDLFSLKR